MKLTHNCPKCSKPAKIQAEFPLGNLVNYVYTCGHLELRSKLILETEETKPIQVLDEPAAPQVQEKSLNNYNLDKWLNWVGCLTKKLPDYSKVPEPTQKELYEDLDHWVSDGGAIKPAVFNPPLEFYSVDFQKCSYEYQIDGVKFIENSQINCLIADAMGVGKTIQALVTLKRNRKYTSPTLILVKGSVLFQWLHEFTTWVDENFLSVMPVTSRAHLIPGFDFYILSMDMISKQDIFDKLLTLGLKTIVIDEVQNFKDPSAKRSIALIKLIRLANIQFKIALSGTPIKNRAAEYFTILNILAPAHFPSLDQFKKYWLVMNEKGVYARLNPLKIEEWQKVTSRWILRREKHEVLKNLPALTRDYQIIEIDDPNIKNTYNHTLDLFQNWLNDNKSGANSTQMLGWLAQLRAITGQAKCKNAVEWVRDFVESTDESISVGIQHKSVRDTLYYVFDSLKLSPLKLSGEDSVYRKADIVRSFNKGDNRILIINMLAGGVGLNLQTCANALVLEREWNSADEEQFESRFHRDGQKQAVTVTYMIAKGTIDEFFHDMVQRKRRILVETGIGKDWDLTGDSNFLRDLSDYVVSHKI